MMVSTIQATTTTTITTVEYLTYHLCVPGVVGGE